MPIRTFKNNDNEEVEENVHDKNFVLEDWRDLDHRAQQST
jgi:hypothetical protein